MNTRSLLWGAVLLLGCAGGNDGERLTPDPVTATSSTSSAGGAGGAGGSTTSSSGGSGGGEQRQGFISGSRLRARYLDGDDGSRVYTGFHDQQLGVDCHPQRALDNAVRCMPTKTAQLLYYADQGCFTPVWYQQPKGCAAPPAYVGLIDYTSASCGAYPYAVGAFLVGPAASTGVYFKSGNNCVFQEIGGQYDVFSLTAASSASFASMTAGVE